MGDVQNLQLKCSLNGEQRQNSNTGDMIFPVAEIISFLSRHMTLEPGDLIITGNLAKAQSLANALTLVQQEHQGDYPTMFTKYPMNFWLNIVVYPAKVMMKLEAALPK